MISTIAAYVFPSVPRSHKWVSGAHFWAFTHSSTHTTICLENAVLSPPISTVNGKISSTQP
ncbi:hypothetical protein EX30DRAFT_344128 [Ascodesmis nigricans]|uniref:Uncharacterized protein n=1 Tax=Ascodesmis nigricans TaxID=341454 RepID=A0A4V3SHT0_9PEZI|nr:hypothetical protein EX30DRAFT_344128 [Ascodesmis nigricans]